MDTEKGAQTEIALIKLGRNMTGETEEVHRKRVGTNAYFKRLPFDSSRKRMTTGMKVGNQDMLFMNGASEQILASSEAIQDMKTNEIRKLTPELRNKIETELQNMAKKGLRTVSVAYKLVDGNAIARQSNTVNREKDVL